MGEDRTRGKIGNRQQAMDNRHFTYLPIGYCQLELSFQIN